AAAALVGLGIALGAAAVHGLDRTLPHEHFVKGVEGAAIGLRVRRVWLFVAAIAIHNIPEGMAIGVGAAGLVPAEATALAAGIAIQDIAEGLVPVVALAAIGYRMPVAVLIGAASGLLEPLAAVAAAAIVGVSEALLPLALGMAGGAMLYVVSHEVIPESHRNDRGGQATAGLIAGFVLMMILDTALGR
ncbi:MAG: ZIP family metal transporter, partial [Pseudomonadota bacterium]